MFPDRATHKDCTVTNKGLCADSSVQMEQKSFFCYSDISAIIFPLLWKWMGARFPLNSQKIRFL